MLNPPTTAVTLANNLDITNWKFAGERILWGWTSFDIYQSQHSFKFGLDYLMPLVFGELIHPRPKN